MTRELRIYGPPGTGKTTYLRRKVEATVKARGADEIRIASLTRAAAAEIGSRVNLPREAVGTLHAHAFRALEQPDLAETPEGIEAWNQRAHKLGEAYVMSNRRRTIDLDDAGGEALVPASEGEGLLQQYSTLRARCMPREAWPPAIAAFASLWEHFKSDTNRLDFNDLIERAIDELPTAPGAPSVLLLDEAQDMSRLDMRLARQWGERCEVFAVVGDPDQNIFMFRGAEPEAFSEGDAEVTVLERSYRVPAAVHRYAVNWLERTLPTRSGATYWPRLLEDGSEAPGRVRRATHTHREPEGLVSELEGHLADGRRVMVLAACSFHLEALLAVLRRRGVPFGNPYRTNDGRLNPLAGAGRVAAFLALQPRDAGGEDRPWTWDEVRRFVEPLKASETLERGAKTFIEAKCTSERILFADEPRPGDQAVDVAAALDLFTEEARSAVLAGDLDWYERNLLSSRASSLAYSLSVARRHGGEALRTQPTAKGGPGIIAGTVHSVKGGETDVCYIFPDLSRAGFEGWLSRGPRHDAVARQFYVGFTRAREELVLCEPSGPYAVEFPLAEEAANG